MSGGGGGPIIIKPNAPTAQGDRAKFTVELPTSAPVATVAALQAIADRSVVRVRIIDRWRFCRLLMSLL